MSAGGQKEEPKRTGSERVLAATERRAQLRAAYLHNDAVLHQDLLTFGRLVGDLTETQELILALIAAGYLNKQIAHICGISQATVKAHVTALLKRLGSVPRTRAAVLYAVMLDRTHDMRANSSIESSKIRVRAGILDHAIQERMPHEDKPTSS